MLRFVVALIVALAFAAPALAAPPPVEDYGRLPGIDLASLSPSGQRYAMVAAVGDQRRVLVLEAADNKPISVQNIGTAKVQALRWIDDDRILIFYIETKKMSIEFRNRYGEFLQCSVFNLTNNKVTRILVNKYQSRTLNVVVGYFGNSTENGKYFGYFGAYSYESPWEGGNIRTTARGMLYPDLYKVNLDTGDFDLELKSEPGRNQWLVGRDGTIIARTQYSDESGGWRVAIGRTGANLLTGRSPSSAIVLQGFGRSAGTILVESEDDGRRVLHEVSLAPDIPGASYEAEQTGAPIFDAATRLWIGNQDADGERVRLFDATRQARVTGAYKAFPGYFAHLKSYSADFRRMIIFTDGGDSSGAYWLVDIDKKSADQIGRAYPSVRAADVGPVRWIDYKASDGVAMRGVLTLPPGRVAKRLPLVVLPHSAPEFYDTPGFDYMAQAFASRGYAVFQPNFRGSRGSGDAFRNAGYGEWGRKMQTDISDGVAELARQDIVDPHRACIVGVNYGGYAALAGVTLQQGIYRCAASYGGYTDPAAVLVAATSGSGPFSTVARVWRRYLGADAPSDSRLDEISPVRLAAQAYGPVLLMQDEDDRDLLGDQMRRMEKALRAAGKPVEVVLIPGVDPQLLQEPSRMAVLKASVAFVMKHNPPDAPPAN